MSPPKGTGKDTPKSARKGTGLTHFDGRGNAHMVDVSGKAVSTRTACARGQIVMTEQTLAQITSGQARKGDVLGVARLAGIMGAKRTADLIPLCHPLSLSKVALELTPDPSLPGICVEAYVKTSGQTGVEMEALTAVSVACLTIYDMVKALEKTMRIEGIHLVSKEGGASGRFEAREPSKPAPSKPAPSKPPLSTLPVINDLG